MLNILWPIFLIVSFIYAIYSGRVEDVNNTIFESGKEAVELTISMISSIGIWSGIVEISRETRLIKHLSIVLNPIVNRLFPDVKKEKEIKSEITMNIIANIMGIGNAATPLGLRAMKSMQKKNGGKDKLTDSMAMLIILNTTSIQVIPTTVIAIRNSLGSKNPSAIIVGVWISTICATSAAIFAAKIMIKKGM